jgi:Ni/Co efflux regulator RcnB
MKTVIKALLAASMLMPVAAQAQDGRGGWDQRGPGPDRGPRPDAGPRPEPSGDRGWQGQGRAERPQPGDFGPDRGPPPPRERRDDGPGRGPGDGGPGFRDDRPDRGPRPDRDDPRPDRGPNVGWGNVGRGNVGRADDGRGWDERRFDDRGPAARDWRAGQRGGAWDRRWRDDDRYDWNRYRAVNRGAYRLPRYYAPSGWGRGYRRFGVGVPLSPVLFSRAYWIGDPYAYRLPEAYGPYRWVRYYDDALLVDLRSGLVIDTVYGIFY